ncbi:MAG TPA: nitroreductase [Rhizomicrobium sp.]
MNVSEALATRRSVRAFKPDPVPRDVVEAILRQAARAPSGGNLQPWKVHVLIGPARDELVRRTRERIAVNPRGGVPEYHIYPPDLTEPYRTRRFAVGEAMYATIGIGREDKPGRLAQFVRNWDFFGAPVGLIFSFHRQMQQGQWSDLGGFLQSIMLLAREYGLSTCAQEAWAPFHEVIRDYLKVPPQEMIFCGMALGHADERAPINRLVSDRAPLEDWAVFKETA